MKDKKEKRDCMFQYAFARGVNPIIEDTGLITRSEADALAEKYRDHLIAHWDDFFAPQMVIWVDCISTTDYHTAALEIDFRDCELKNGNFYRIKRDRIF